ncbi:MAG: TIGR00295 family protein [Archaeoglobaceae archaeon]|nr:TIGR00295 family protein [Archaeoglobaceae archaeon]MCX8152663.1 TIGR00295 family protein [Archaeoglobaceae archaeon]MDW8013664.1 TIGR00295 family protein [Archaeoglobaceae archaeon]
MKIPEKVRELWEKYNLPENIRKHCIAVAKTALEIADAAKKRGYNVDVNAVLIGALLHDIGRAITNDPFKHFLMSAKILEKEGFSEKLIKIVERHFSAGLKAEEAEKLGLEKKDYMPETLEEKIVSFADNITFGDKKVGFEDFIRRLDNVNRENPQLSWITEISKKRAREQKDEIEKISGLKF